MIGMGIPEYPIDMEAFSPNGEVIALWNADAGTIQLLSARNGDRISEFSVQARRIESMIFSSDGKILAFGTDEGVIQLWDISSNQFHGKPLVGHHGRVSSIAFSSDGTMLASGGSQDYTIMLWDVAKGKNINTFDNPASILGVAFIDGNDVLASIDDGDRIRYTDDGGRIRLWNLVEGKEIRVRNTDINGISSVTFSPDGKMLFLGNQEGSIWLWNVYDGQPYNVSFAKIPSKENSIVSVTDIAFDLDVGLVIATDYHGSIWVWDLETGQLLGDPLNRRLRMVYTSVTMYGYRFATGASDIWTEINPETWVSQLCAQAGRNMTLAEWRQYFAGESYHQTCPQWPTGK